MGNRFNVFGCSRGCVRRILPVVAVQVLPPRETRWIRRRQGTSRFARAGDVILCCTVCAWGQVWYALTFDRTGVTR